MRYILTLDSHDYWGPFANDQEAMNYAKAQQFGSWTIVAKVSALSVVNVPIQRANGPASQGR